MNRVKSRSIGILLIVVLSIFASSTVAWAGPATAWSQRTLDVTVGTCMTRSVSALRAAGYKDGDIQRDERAVSAVEGTVSSWLICYSLSTNRTLVTIFTAARELDAATAMRNRLRDFVLSGR